MCGRRAVTIVGTVTLLWSASLVGAQAQQGQPRIFGGGAGSTLCSFCYNQYESSKRDCQRFGNANDRSQCEQAAFDYAQGCERHCVNK
jgi:hypothetical protein